MPELPEVETSCRGIAPHIVDRQVKAVVIRQPQLRWPVPANLPELLTGEVLRSVQRRAKYIVLAFDAGHLLIHLGMSGNVRIVSPREPLLKHDHVDIEFVGGKLLRLNDPRRFGAVLWSDGDLDQYQLLAHLGPEPLSEDFYSEYLFARSRKRTQAIKTFIMDSRVVVGVGNIYANEALFKAGIRPSRAAGTVTRKQFERLVEEIKTVLARAIEQGGTTLKDFVGGDGKPG